MIIGAFGTWGGWAALTAIGTVGAVIVAVFTQWWIGRKAKKRVPSLTLAFDRYAVQEANVAGAVLPYVRIAVSNGSSRDAARSVEVLIESS